MSVDVFNAIKFFNNPYNFVSNNPISRIDPDGNYDIDPRSSRQERKALKAIGDNYTNYLNSLKAGSSELNALLKYSGYKNKEDLLAAWNKKGNGSIVLRFSSHEENDSDPDRGHEQTGAPGPDKYYLHPNGGNSLSGAFATGRGVQGGGGTIILSKALLGLQKILNSKDFVTPAKSENGENTSFDYESMKNGGYLFINRIMSHEMTHVGADVNKLTKSVVGISGNKPSWISSDGNISFMGIPFTLYHRGDVFESEAYLKRVNETDIEYGFAVNVYFRYLGKMDCSVKKNPLMEQTQADNAVRTAILNYIRSDQGLLRSFKPNNKSNIGSWKIPQLDH